LSREAARRSRLTIGSFELGHWFELWILGFGISHRQSRTARLSWRDDVH
jgi:hypothetical protein